MLGHSQVIFEFYQSYQIANLLTNKPVSIDLYVKGRKDEEYTPVLESKQFNYFCKDKARMVENLKQWKLLDKKRFIKSMMIEI